MTTQEGGEVRVGLDIHDRLIEAVKIGRFKDVKRCLGEVGCDPLARDGEGSSALMWASINGHEDCVRLLLPVSDPLIQDHDGHSALILAALHGHVECVRLLLPVSDPLARDNHGVSALMCAARGGHSDCARWLLPHSDPLIQDNSRCTALMCAALNGSEACVGLLLPHSDPLALDNQGYSASQMAKACGYITLTEMIDAYVLSKQEAALMAQDVSPVSVRGSPHIRL